MTRRFAVLAVATAAAGCLVAGSVLAAAAPASAQLCIPILAPCPAPTPSPTPTGGGLPTAPALPGVPGAPVVPGVRAVPPAAPGAPDAATSPLPLVPDDSMVVTQPPAQLGARSLSFTGVPTITPVSLRLANGRRVAALRLTADSITIEGFALTVRAATGPVLATTADTMVLRGRVVVYLDSLTATTADGRSYTLGASTPPPKDGITGSILRVTLGLVGTRADAISYTNTDQRLSD